MINSLKKGFTLVELLIVIAVLAVLATAAVFILNPAELLARGRDSTRVSDLAVLNSAIKLYVTDRNGVSDFSLGTCNYGTHGRISDTATGTISHTFTSAGSNDNARRLGGRGVDGTGWVDINFRTISTGSPLGRLPADPVNDANYTYRYKCLSESDYEINAVFESMKYNHTSACASPCTRPGLGLADGDGGDEPSSPSGASTICNAATLPVGNDGTGCVYEVGNKLTL